MSKLRVPASARTRPNPAPYKGRFQAVLATALVLVGTFSFVPASYALGTTGLVITEVDPAGSGAASYAADWFEVTNPTTTAVDITGWKMDDNSNGSPVTAEVALVGITKIVPGESVVFLEAANAGVSATTIANFKTAWFGSGAAAGVLKVGYYTGSGVGLSTTADAVNLFDAGGTVQANVSFGVAPANKTFDNAVGASGAIATASAVGVNGGFVSTGSSETGSPGTTGAFTGVDLSRYVRVGRFNLPEPTRTTPPANSLLAQEASSVTYDWDTDTLFVVGDGGTSVVQVSKTGALIDSMTLPPGGSPQGTTFYDTEGITYVGNGQFVMTEERDRQVNLFTYVAGGILQRTDAKTVKLGTTIGNIGLEGVTNDPSTAGFVLVKERDPQGIFQTGIDFTALTATNGSPTTINSTNLFDPTLAGTSDFSDVSALSNIPALNHQPDGSHLLVISQESGQVVNVDRSGTVSSRLTIVSDPGNPLSVPDQTNEGVTMDRQGVLYVVNEDGGGDADHPQLWVYARSNAIDTAPTAVSLQNAATSLPENTSTAAPIKLADIVVTDADGIGANVLSVTGADASSFHILGTALYLNAGVTLSHTTKPSYTVTVAVDDASVGGSPDATTPYTLAIDAASSGSTQVVISEVAPWSSGNSTLAKDWFEVTNLGGTTANLTDWTMDDNSNSASVSVPMSGVTSLAPGASAIFIESATDASTAFNNIWFGGTPPAGLQIGRYSGSGVGLSTGGDAVNLFDAGGTLQANVSFGTAASGPFATFDNAAGLNNATISTLSAVGVNGAFAVTDGAFSLIGSPGSIGGPASTLVSIAAQDPSAAEAGSDPGTFRISRTGSTVGPLTVAYTIATGSGQATAADYTPTLTGTTSIPNGAAFVDLTIAPVDDALVEGSETVTLTLTDTGSYDVGSPASATVTIADNDVANQPPTAVSLSNTVPLLVESASTASPIRVADIGITDDGQGTNSLDVAGTDAAFFQVTGSSLYLKAGTALSHATKPTYNVTVTVDDTTVGSTPDTSTPFALSIAQAVPASAIIISEVAPWSSSNSGALAVDWFEVTNVGSTTLDTTGWKMDDNSHAFSSAVALAGVSSIAPGQSVIFLETADLAGKSAAFKSLWFGASPPAGLQIGNYTGGGVGLSSTADEVTLFDAGGGIITGIGFGAAASGPFATFENQSGLGSATLPFPLVSHLSLAGQHGAFVAANDAAEIGSPGTLGAFDQANLNITAPASATFGAADQAISTTGGSGSGAVTFDAGASSACAVVTNLLHVTSGAGTCSITATKAGDGTFAPTTSALFTITINPAVSVAAEAPAPADAALAAGAPGLAGGRPGAAVSVTTATEAQALADLSAETIQVTGLHRALTPGEQATYYAWQFGSDGTGPLYVVMKKFSLDTANPRTDPRLVAAEAFVNYLLSTDGQAAIAAAGFTPLASPPVSPPIPPADIDLNGGVGLSDIGQITGRWNQMNTLPGWTRADIDDNGGVGLSDIGAIIGIWNHQGFVPPN